MLGNTRQNFCAGPAVCPGVIDNQKTPGLSHGVDDHFNIERNQPDRIDHLSVNTHVGKQFVCAQTLDNHIRYADDRDVVAEHTEAAPARVHCKRVFRHKRFRRIKQPVFNEDHRIVIANCRNQAAFGVMRILWSNDF